MPTTDQTQSRQRARWNKMNHVYYSYLKRFTAEINACSKEDAKVHH